MSSMSREEERNLFRRVRRFRDSAARDRLIRRYLPLARHTARRFEGREPLDDLFQVASYALVKAVDRFDPERGLAFTSYAIPTMVGELKRHARDTSWGMRVPRALQERVLRTERVVAHLQARDGRSPSTAEIAEEMGVTSEEVLEALEASTQHVLDSLDVPVGDEEGSGRRIDYLGENDGRYELVDAGLAVAPALRGLPERERAILSMRFGEELPQSEIARRLGISQMHVSRLLRRTLDQLAEQVDEPLAAS